jgi:hypothetical protein
MVHRVLVRGGVMPCSRLPVFGRRLLRNWPHEVNARAIRLVLVDCETNKKGESKWSFIRSRLS